jgi:hypothetical protein
MLAAAQAPGASDDAAIRTTFVKPWMQAMQSHDAVAIQRFYHPLVLACANPNTKQFFEYVSGHEAHSAVAGSYHVAKLAPLEGPAPSWRLPEDGFSLSGSPHL